jgi:hypothetical protein
VMRLLIHRAPDGRSKWQTLGAEVWMWRNRNQLGRSPRWLTGGGRLDMAPTSPTTTKIDALEAGSESGWANRDGGLAVWSNWGKQDPRDMTGDSIQPFRFRLVRFETGNRGDKRGDLQRAAQQQELGLYVTPTMPRSCAARQVPNEGGCGCWLFECAPKVRGDISGCSTAERILERKRMLCEEIPAAHDRSNRVVTSMEQKGESETSSRVEDSAHTPNFWNRSRRWSWVGRTGGSRRYCFWKSLCNLPGDLAWTFVRGAGDGLEIGTVGVASLRAQKLE